MKKKWYLLPHGSFPFMLKLIASIFGAFFFHRNSLFSVDVHVKYKMRLFWHQPIQLTCKKWHNIIILIHVYCTCTRNKAVSFNTFYACMNSGFPMAFLNSTQRIQPEFIQNVFSYSFDLHCLVFLFAFYLFIVILLCSSCAVYIERSVDSIEMLASIVIITIIWLHYKNMFMENPDHECICSNKLSRCTKYIRASEWVSNWKQIFCEGIKCLEQNENSTNHWFLLFKLLTS